MQRRNQPKKSLVNFLLDRSLIGTDRFVKHLLPLPSLTSNPEVIERDSHVETWKPETRREFQQKEEEQGRKVTIVFLDWRTANPRGVPLATCNYYQWTISLTEWNVSNNTRVPESQEIVGIHHEHAFHATTFAATQSFQPITSFSIEITRTITKPKVTPQQFTPFSTTTTTTTTIFSWSRNRCPYANE